MRATRVAEQTVECWMCSGKGQTVHQERTLDGEPAIGCSIDECPACQGSGKLPADWAKGSNT
jgi:DnaJ-class molecular chaperone